MKDYSRVTLRPWNGPDAVTGLTMDEFAERLEGCTASPAITRAAVSICRSYRISGLADPAYIANTIAASLA